jgi:hypothetical protein
MRRKTKWADKHDEADIFFFSDPREESEKWTGLDLNIYLFS